VQPVAAEKSIVAMPVSQGQQPAQAGCCGTSTDFICSTSLKVAEVSIPDGLFFSSAGYKNQWLAIACLDGLNLFQSSGVLVLIN